MEIAKVKSYNNPSFGAQLHILGSKETIQKNLIPIIEAQAKKIGNKDDLIILYFGKPMLDVLPGLDDRILQQCRSIYARSIINNIPHESDISYCIFENELADSKIVRQSVFDYLHDLRSALKARPRIKK